MSFWNVMAILGSTLFAGTAIAPILSKGKTKRLQSPKGQAAQHNLSIDVIIPCYLESKVIGPKISQVRKSLSSYNGDGKIIVVASDADTAMAAADADIVIETGRLGKAAACNAGLAKSDAEVIVFTDANCTIHPLTWPSITVEALTNLDLISGRKGETGGSERLFWLIEDFIKNKTGTLETLSVAGEFIATRRSSMNEIQTDRILDDLAIALDYNNRGLLVGIAGEITTSESAAEQKQQWERRIRIAQGLILEALPQTGNLLKTPPGRNFLAHKMYRVTLATIGFWLLALSLTCTNRYTRIATISILTASYFDYSGKIPGKKTANNMLSIIGMQFVGPAAIIRTISETIMTQRKSTRGIWNKIER